MQTDFRDRLNIRFETLNNSPIARGGVADLTPLLPEEGWTRFADGVVGAADEVEGGRGHGSDGIVRNKYHGNPGKLAAWTSASHVEKARKKKEPTQ